jgi:hypothetical protein
VGADAGPWGASDRQFSGNHHFHDVTSSISSDGSTGAVAYGVRGTWGVRDAIEFLRIPFGSVSPAGSFFDGFLSLISGRGSVQGITAPSLTVDASGAATLVYDRQGTRSDAGRYVDFADLGSGLDSSGPISHRGATGPVLEAAADGAQTVTYEGVAFVRGSGWLAGMIEQTRPGAGSPWSAPTLVIPH